MRYDLRQWYATLLLVLGPVIFASVLWIHGPARIEWWAGSLVAILILTIYGYNIGSHYAFTHRLFRFSRPVELALIYTSTISACASPLSWAVHHNAHHRYVETPDDPHSPHILGWRALFATNYKTDKASTLFVRHLLRDPVQRFVDSDRGFWLVTLSWPLFVECVWGMNGLLYLWLLPVWYVLAVSVAFVFSHTGQPDERSGSRAVNSRLLAALSLGDGNHLDHHQNIRACGPWVVRFAHLIGAQTN